MSLELLLKDLKVLVVDDHADTRQMIAGFVKRAGALAVTAGSVEEALAVFNSERPDLVVSDIGMPGGTGYDLVAKIRSLSDPAGGSTPVVAVTAWTGSEVKSQALKAGFQEHIGKPVNSSFLVKTLAKLAGRS